MCKYLILQSIQIIHQFKIKIMKFHKYHGTGNDFIMIDGRNNFQFSTEQIKNLCHRNFGIGSNGVLIIRNNKKVDFTMEFYNPDGSVATFCGNGARCIVNFAKQLQIIDNDTIFEAKDGFHKAQIIHNLVDLQMIDVENHKIFNDIIYMNTGTHHVVKFVENVDEIDILKEAPLIRYSKNFKPEGTNVNYVQIIDNDIKIRTYEKGVEAETLSCGTGVTASALAFAIKNNYRKKLINVQTKGGDLQVSFEKSKLKFTDIHLIGNAEKVFEGEISNYLI